MVHDGVVSLDLSSIQTLQCALRRGEHFSLTSGRDGESREDRTAVGSGAHGGRARKGRARGASYSGYGGARRAPEAEERKESPSVGFEAAVAWRLLCLSREVTTLRIHGYVRDADALGAGTGPCVCGFLSLGFRFTFIRKCNDGYVVRGGFPDELLRRHIISVPFFPQPYCLKNCWCRVFCPATYADVCGCFCCKGECLLSMKTPDRDLGQSASAPERPIELQTFPALQDLRLEGVPLEHVQGKVISGCLGFVGLIVVLFSQYCMTGKCLVSLCPQFLANGMVAFISS